MKILINSGRVTPFLSTRKQLVKSLVESGNKVFISGYQTGYERELLEIGATFIETPVKRSNYNFLSDIKLLFSYIRIIKRENIEIVHSYTIKPNIYGSIAARLAGVKKIYPTVNGLGYLYTFNSFKVRLIRFATNILYKIAFLFSNKVFFQNPDDAKEIIGRGIIKPEKCVIIPGSGIDLNEFYELPQPSNVSFIMVTRLLKSKGVYEYLEAARIVKKKYTEVEFKLVGPIDPNPDSVKDKELQRFIEEGVINYLGVSNQVHKLLGASSVFVLPSYYREGVPHAILEAMATGRAIITTDMPGCRETVVDGSNGFLIPAKNSKILAEKMMWMIENHESVLRMGKESLHIAKEKFDLEIVNEKILKTILKNE